MLANTILQWNDIHALVSNHLIALDKCSSVRPIGIGETLCHKNYYWKGYLLYYIHVVTYGGVKSGIECVIHAMNEMYSQNCTSDDWGVLLVVASNAFKLTVSTILLCYGMHVCYDHIVLFFI